MDEDDVRICEEYQVRHTAEHETLLAFNGDDQNEEFQGWWNTVGVKLFVKHYNKTRKR
jgi:hypothetical protein